MDPSPPQPEPTRPLRGGPRPVQPGGFVIQPDGLTKPQRQERDRHRLMAMQLEAFNGPTWHEKVQPDVWSYALRVLPKKIMTGEIFAMRVRLHQKPAEDLALPAGGISLDDAEDLASEVALRSIGRFHAQLKANTWDLSKDITFRTWFVGLCALRFPGPYRKWLREQRSYTEVFDPDVEELDTGPEPSSVIYVVEFERYLDQMDDPVTRFMFAMDTVGFTDVEIADATRMTVKAVEGRLARERQKARRLRDVEARRDRPRDFGSGVA